jgi:hypothetical protein
MSAKSKKQPIAAGAALAAKRREHSKSSLKDGQNQSQRETNAFAKEKALAIRPSRFSV